MKKYSFLMLFYALSAHSEMALLDDEALSDQTGQTGITLSARAEFGTGTRISYNNTDASYVDPTEYWLVVDELTGAIEIKGLKLDLINNFGPTQNKSALQWTMPEEVIFDELKTEGIYVGPGRTVGASHQFIMGIEMDGELSMPAQTKINIFPVN